MKFSSRLKEGILLKRHRPFLAEIAVKKDDHRFIFCPNQGQLHGCDILGSRVWFSESNIPHSKYPLTWELVEINGGYLVCVNAMLGTNLVLEGLKNGTISELSEYTVLKENMTIDQKGTGVNIALTKTSKITKTDKLKVDLLEPDCYIVIKNVIMGDEIHRGFYPDMPNETDTEQLRNLTESLEHGVQVILFYCVLHTGIECVFPADHIDKEYGFSLRDAMEKGLKVMAYKSNINLTEIELVKKIPVNVPARDFYKKLNP